MHRLYKLIRAGGCAAVLALLLPGGATAEEVCEPCFSLPYFTLDGTPTGEVRVEGANLKKGEPAKFMATVGEIEVDITVTNNRSSSMATGFWSYYLTEPQPPIVDVSEGDHQDRIELSWELVDDRIGPPVTENEVLIYRNGTQLTTVPLRQTQYQDFNVFPGEEYEYSIVPANELGQAHRDDQVGFLNPNGEVIGEVETPNGNPVNEVKVVLTPNLGRSAEFGQLLYHVGTREESYVYFPDMLTGLEQSYTIEGWFRSRELKAQTFFAAVDSATTRPFVRIGLNVSGELQWEHQGGTSTTPDIVTTRNDYTSDAEWHHFAAVMADSNFSMTLYVDGRIVGRGTAADSVGSQRAQIVLGKKGPIEHEQYLEGRLDDWRVWSKSKTRAEIRRDMDRTLEGDEGGLQAYWKFDEVKGEKVFDLTANDNDGLVCKIVRSDFNAPVFVSGVTDTLGRYAIKGIFYGAGQTFTATPQKVTPIGTSLDLDGVDDYLDFAQDRLDLTGGYTLEGWFKNPGTHGDMTIFAAEDPADNSNHVNVTLLADGRLQLTHEAVNIATTELYNDEFWYHFAATHDIADGALTFYVNGEVVGSSTGAAIGELSAFVIGRQAPNLSAQYFRGWLDEIRVWDRGRNEEQINAVRNQFLSGSETGMIAYWHFNEGDGVLALDATESNLTADLIGGIPWSDDIPLNEVFVNTFDPESRQVILNSSNTSVDRVDFTDISQIAVTGFVKYSGTTCFIEGAEILVNGESLVPPRLTDENGRFVVEFEPGSRGDQVSVKYRDHDFAPAFIELPTITRPIAGLFFEDIVKREISGIVAGGACRLPITPSQGQIEVEVSTVDGCFVANAVPDSATGTYTIRDVPPVIYNLTISHPNPEIDAFFTADTLSTEDDNRTGVDFIYRAAPEVEISGFPTNGCGLRVMEMANEYDLDISVFESYTSQGNVASCPADSGSLVIFDQIGDVGEVELGYENGQAQYRVIGRFPNIVGGGDNPYQKSIQVTAEDELGRNAVVEEWTYVTGNRPRTINFATTSPQLPFMILREPPGDQSSSFIAQGETISSSVSFGYNTSTSTNLFATIHMGPDITFSTGGIFFSKGTKIDITLDYTLEFDFTLSQSTTQEQDWSFTTTETFSTAGGGDVYVGGALNLLYGITDVLEVDDTTCETTVREDLIVIPDGFATTFIHSESFILDTVIPELQLLGETESAALWQSFINHNNALKQAASFSRNISFDAGTQFDYTESTAVTQTLTQEFQMEIDQTVALTIGAVVDGLGATGGVKTTWSMTQGESRSTSNTSTTTVGFTLADDDAGDNFSVNVKNDIVYGTPVFDLVSGESSCPWEPGTVQIDQPQLSISPSQQVDVDPLQPAVYDLTLGNTSESSADRTYDLQVVNESNPGGAGIAFNGVLVEDKLSFDVPFGQAVQAVMEIFRGPVEYQYDDLFVELVSACESGISDQVSVSAHFIIPCSEVNLALPETGFVFTSADTGSGHQIAVTLDGYDRLDLELERLELQYRPASGGDWFVAATVPVVDLAEDFKLLTWDISPSIISDNDYQLRAQAHCGIGLVPGTSAVIAGTIDRSGPQPLGLPEPSDGILDPEDVITVLFNEDVNCGEISIGAGHVTLTNSVTGEDIDFDYTCGANQVVIDPNLQNTFIENLTLRATVGPVEDLLGNQSPEPVEWELFVNRNPIEWAGLDLNNIAIFEDQTFETTRLLFNNGGSPRSFTFSDVDIATQGIILPGPRPISIPPWLTVEPREGTIQPGAALEVSFEVDAPTVGAGSFETTLYASAGLGEEPRDVDIRVLCYPPAWGVVDPTDFQNSMTITATLETDGELSEDEYDQVGVFIDGHLHGMATVKFVEAFAQLANTPTHEVFLTVYGNQTDVGKDLELRVWDASACQELGLVLESFTFTDNARIGTPTNPATITATSQIITQLEFSDGWNWFSLNLIPNDLSINGVLGGLEATVGDLVKNQLAFSGYSETSGWVGTLTEVDNESMFQIKLAQPATLEIIGYAADVELTPLAINSGWNWISYLPQNSIDVNSALETLPAQTGDIIKNQVAFAQFIEGLGWIGSLEFMNPGQGYQLFSQDSGFLQYPFFEAPAAKPVARALPQVASLGWELDPTPYRHSMVLTAEVVGGGMLDSEQDVVAAFVGDELRGLGHTIYVPDQGRHLAFVTVYSDVEEGELVEFSFYDGEALEEGFVPTVLDFEVNAVAGDAAEPFVLETRERRMGDRGFIPDTFVLSPAFPNPFNPSTQIGYGVPIDGQVEISIYNVVGQKIRTLVSGFEQAGYRYAVWDGRDGSGRVVPTGVYFSLMQTEGFRAAQKLMLLK